MRRLTPDRLKEMKLLDLDETGDYTCFQITSHLFDKDNYFRQQLVLDQWNIAHPAAKLLNSYKKINKLHCGKL